MAKQYMLGAGGKEEYYVMGIDIKEKYGPLPVWGWGLGLGALAYYFFKKKR